MSMWKTGNTYSSPVGLPNAGLAYLNGFGYQVVQPAK
jgi:hypothetical protein